MASSSHTLLCEGVFAINKPPNLTSAQVIRDCQSHFKPSKLFQPWLDREQARKDAESHNQRKKRKSWKQRQPLQVKMGHGGTLDPMATGVLILGVGNGTKQLNRFLECTKSYDTVVLFGAATDSYDSVGKVVGRRDYQHVTRQLVEEALKKFRGKIRQRPPVFSALRVDGKRLYEYAREGLEIPKEIEERPVEVESLEMVEWMEGGTHPYHWPVEEAEAAQKKVADAVLGLNTNGSAQIPQSNTNDNNPDLTLKRKREEPAEAPIDDSDSLPNPKRSRPSQSPSPKPRPHSAPSDTPQALQRGVHTPPPQPENQAPCPAPAVRLRMTATSGFYVRSLCHDLGAAVDSLGLMASLVRTRQGDFEIRRNVLEYGDLEKGEEVWAPRVEGMLREWRKNQGDGDDAEGGTGVDGGANGRRRNSSSEPD